ncbi:MAG: hypothetical protein Q8J76_09740, partial [Desulfobulbaceae bacterium]|nr:hypothetical protein [Desulfobulbaceae bacterium]
MLTIDDFDIPNTLLSELRAIADQIKGGQLLALAKAVPSLAVGVRLTAANTRFIRQRLLPDSGRLRDEVRDLLAAEGLNWQLVMVFSVTVLTECLPLFLAIYGRERMLAALLVDSRPEVRQLAVSYCREEDWHSKPLFERDEAITALANIIQPFLRAMAPLMSGSSSTSEPGEDLNSEEFSVFRSKIATLEERLRHAKDDGRALKKLEVKVEGLKNQRAALEEKLDRERQLRLAAEKMETQAEARVQTLHQEQERAVQAGVEAEMQSVVRAWLVEPLRL